MLSTNKFEKTFIGSQVVDSKRSQIGFVFDSFKGKSGTAVVVLLTRGRIDGVIDVKDLEDVLRDRLELLIKVSKRELNQRLKKSFGMHFKDYREKALLNLAYELEMSGLSGFIKKSTNMILLSPVKITKHKVLSPILRTKIPALNLKPLENEEPGYVGVVNSPVHHITSVRHHLGLEDPFEQHDTFFNLTCGTETINITAHLPINISAKDEIQVCGILQYPSLQAKAIYAPKQGAYWTRK